MGGHESAGTGYFNQSGGSNVASGNLQIGGGGGVGTYTISAGTLDVDGTLYVGSGGTGTFHIIGDQATIEVDGYSQNADSTLELTINSISPINVDGAISLAGALDVEFASLPDIEDVFPIFINDGDDLVSGIFRDKPEGYVFSLAGTYIDMVLTYEAKPRRRLDRQRRGPARGPRAFRNSSAAAWHPGPGRLASAARIMPAFAIAKRWLPRFRHRAVRIHAIPPPHKGQS